MSYTSFTRLSRNPLCIYALVFNHLCLICVHVEAVPFAPFLAHGVKLAEAVQSFLCVLQCESGSWRIQDEALLCNLLLSAQMAK